MMGLSSWRGSVTSIGMRVVSMAAKKMSLRWLAMASWPDASTETSGGVESRMRGFSGWDIEKRGLQSGAVVEEMLSG